MADEQFQLTGTPSKSEVVGIMKDGGMKLCDYAIEQWASDKYHMSKDVTNEWILRWKYIREQIKIIARELS